MQRTVRAPRRCPFCDELIRENAIKCRNCGEFLDDVERGGKGRDSGEKQPTFVIEKAVFQNEGARPGGEGGPALIANSPAKRIEHSPTKPAGGQPALPNHGGASSAPTVTGGATEWGDETVPASEVPRPSGISGVVSGMVSRTLLPILRPKGPGEAEKLELAKTETVRRPLAKREGGSLAKRDKAELARVASPATEPAKEKAAKGEASITVDVQGRNLHRKCGICATDIFTTDNYCFHCGQKYAHHQFRFRLRPSREVNWAVIAVVVACLVPHLLYFLVERKPSSVTILTTGAAAPAISLVAAVRAEQGGINRIIGIILTVLSLIIVAAPVILSL